MRKREISKEQGDISSKKEETGSLRLKERFDSLVDYLAERQKLAFAFCLTFSGIANVSGIAAYEQREKIRETSAEIYETVEGKIIKALRERKKEEVSEKQEISKKAFKLFQELMEGKEREIDLSNFYIARNSTLEQISPSDREKAEENYKTIIAGGEKIKEQGGEIEDVFAYLWSYTGAQGIDNANIIDLLVRPRGDHYTCEARYEFLVSAMEDLYPELSANGEFHARIFGAWEDEKGRIHGSHIQLTLEDEEHGLRILDGGRVRSGEKDPSVVDVEAHIYALSETLVTAGITSYEKLGMSDPQGDLAIDPRAIDGLEGPTSRGKHQGPPIEESKNIPAPKPLSAEAALAHQEQPLHVRVLNEGEYQVPETTQEAERSYHPREASLRAKEAEDTLEATTLGAADLRQEYRSALRSEMPVHSFDTMDEGYGFGFYIPSYNDPNVTSMLPLFKKRSELSPTKEEIDQDIYKNLRYRNDQSFFIPGDQPIPDDWLPIMGKKSFFLNPRIITEGFPSEALWWQLHRSILSNHDFERLVVVTDTVAPPEYLAAMHIPLNEYGAEIVFENVETISSLEGFPNKSLDIRMDSGAKPLDAHILAQATTNISIDNATFRGEVFLSGHGVTLEGPELQEANFILSEHTHLELYPGFTKTRSNSYKIHSKEHTTAKHIYINSEGIETETLNVNSEGIDIDFRNNVSGAPFLRARSFAGSTGKRLLLQFKDKGHIDPETFAESDFERTIIKIVGDEHQEIDLDLFRDALIAAQHTKNDVMIATIPPKSEDAKVRLDKLIKEIGIPLNVGISFQAQSLNNDQLFYSFLIKTKDSYGDVPREH